MKATKRKPRRALATAAAKNQLAIPQPQQDSTLMMIERAARDPNVDIDKMQRLLDMKMQVMTLQRKDEYQRAMNACQKEMQPVAKQAYNDQTKSNYAKLEHVDEAIRPIYTDHGFSLEFDSQTLPSGERKVICEVMHTGGYNKTKELVAPLDMLGPKGTPNKTSLHGLGSTLSYLQRYLTLMVFNVVLKGRDNDGTGDPNAPKQEPEDRFTQVESEDHRVLINEDAWDGKHVIIKGKSQMLQGNDKVTPEHAAKYLMTVMEKRKHKQSRIDLINENLPLVRALSADHPGMIDQLHELADKGE